MARLTNEKKLKMLSTALRKEKAVGVKHGSSLENLFQLVDWAVKELRSIIEKNKNTTLGLGSDRLLAWTKDRGIQFKPESEDLSRTGWKRVPWLDQPEEGCDVEQCALDQVDDDGEELNREWDEPPAEREKAQPEFETFGLKREGSHFLIGQRAPLAKNFVPAGEVAKTPQAWVDRFQTQLKPLRKSDCYALMHWEKGVLAIGTLKLCADEARRYSYKYASKELLTLKPSMFHFDDDDDPVRPKTFPKVDFVKKELGYTLIVEDVDLQLNTTYANAAAIFNFLRSSWKGERPHLILKQ